LLSACRALKTCRRLALPAKRREAEAKAPAPTACPLAGKPAKPARFGGRLAGVGAPGRDREEPPGAGGWRRGGAAGTAASRPSSGRPAAYARSRGGRRRRRGRPGAGRPENRPCVGRRRTLAWGGRRAGHRAPEGAPEGAGFTVVDCVTGEPPA